MSQEWLCGAKGYTGPRKITTKVTREHLAGLNTAPKKLYGVAKVFYYLSLKTFQFVSLFNFIFFKKFKNNKATCVDDQKPSLYPLKV